MIWILVDVSAPKVHDFPEAFSTVNLKAQMFTAESNKFNRKLGGCAQIREFWMRKLANGTFVLRRVELPCVHDY